MINIDTMLSDYHDRFCNSVATGGFDIFSPLETASSFTGETGIEELYNKLKEPFRSIFIRAHENLNKLFNFMNYKAVGNRHFNAEESRQLDGLIDLIFDFQSDLKAAGFSLQIEETYATHMRYCKKFLSTSGGSEIPERYREEHQIKIIKYTPIFSLSEGANSFVISTADELDAIFNNDYMHEIISQMNHNLDAGNTIEVSGKAKELLESCMRTILDDRDEVIDTDKMDMGELMNNTKKVLNLKSENKDVVKVINGLTQINLGLSELRNHKGSGHGRNMNNHTAPTAREAKLAMHCAIALTSFLWDLHSSRENPRNQ